MKNPYVHNTSNAITICMQMCIVCFALRIGGYVTCYYVGLADPAQSHIPTHKVSTKVRACFGTQNTNKLCVYTLFFIVASNSAHTCEL